MVPKFKPFEATFNILCDKYKINEFDETSTCREFPISFLLFDTDNLLLVHIFGSFSGLDPMLV